MSFHSGARLRVVGALVLLALMILPTVARADALDDGVRRIGLQLQCPVCEGETVADSPSGLAGDMRSVIRAKLVAGEPDQQILDEFVGSYGDSILTEPPKRGISLGVWVGPVVALVLGAVLVLALLRTWRRVPSRVPVTTTGELLDPAVVDELQRFREEFGR